MSQIGKLSVKIDANTVGFQKGIKDVTQNLKKVGTQLRTSVDQFAKWGAGIATAAGVAGAAIVKTNLANIRELNNLSMAANTSVADFQRMAYGAEQFGISQEKLGDVLKDVNDRVGDFITTGAGPMADFFEQIAPKVGVTAEQFQKLNGKDALQLYVTSLERANLSQEEMTFFMEAMASDSTRLLPLLRDNGEQMNKMAQEAEDLGIGLSEIDVENAIEAQKALDSITSMLEAQTMKAVADLAPLIEIVVKQLRDAIKNVDDFGITTIEIVESVGKAFAYVGNIVLGWKAIFKGVELLVRSTATAIVRSMSMALDALASIPNTILEGWRLLFIEASKLLSHLNDSASQVMRDLAEDLGNLKVDNTWIKDIEQSVIDAENATLDAFNAIAATPLPTDNVTQWAEETKAKLAEVKKAREEALGGGEEGEGNEGGPDTTGRTFGGSVEDKILTAQQNLQTETEMILEQMGIRYEMEEALQLRHLEVELAQLAEQKAAKGKLTMEQTRQEAMLLKKKNALTRALTIKGVGETLNALASGSKKMQKVQQAYALMNAGISISAGIARAQELGFPANIAEMARVIAVGAKAIAGIKAKKPPAVRGAGGLTTPSIATPSAPQPVTPQMGQRRIDINITGEGLMSTEQVRNLLGQINEATDDGLVLNTGG